MNFRSWADGRRRQLLPIDSYLPSILSTMRGNQVVIVEAETGAGKTIRLGQSIILSDPGVEVSMTQTRRPAVRWNGKRIAFEMGCQPGELVGWRLFGEDPVVSRETRLTLTIDQSLANRIRRQGCLPSGVIIVDEAHERSVSIDLLLGLIKQYLPVSPDSRVIVTSATIDTQKFSAFFGGAPVISVPGRTHPVEVFVERLNYAEHHTPGAISAAEKVLERFAKGELSIVHPDESERVLRGEVSASEARRLVVESGAVAILLPGKDDIREAMAALRRKAEELMMTERVEILPCHSEIKPEEQDAIQAPIKPGTIRFVAGTEIIRSSVTVHGLVGLVDSLQVKRLVTDPKGVAHLTKVAVSKAEADQAKGRPGRTQPGFYIPVSFKDEYEFLEKWPQPAILREPITSVVLQVAAADLDVRTFPFIDPPSKEKVDVAVVRLQKLGALTKDEVITELGRVLVRFPIDPERARTLVTADELGVLPEAIVAVAVLEGEGIFFRPAKEAKVVVGEKLIRELIAASAYRRSIGDEYRRPRPEEVDLAKELPRYAVLRDDGRFEVDPRHYDFPNREGARYLADLTWRGFAAGTDSDFVAAVRAYRAFRSQEREVREAAWRIRQEATREPGNGNGLGSRRWIEDQLYGWCMDSFLNFKRLRMVQDTISQIREELEGSPLRLENHVDEPRDFSSEALTKSLASGHVDFVVRKQASYERFDGPMGDGIQIGYSSACRRDAKLVLIGGVRKVPMGRRGSEVLLADIAAPIEASWLLEVMPQLCSAKIRRGSAQYDAGSGTVRGTEDTSYGDVLIAESSIQVRGEAGSEVFAAALIADQTGHPAEKPNRVYRDEVFQFGIREGVDRGIREALLGWYRARLGGTCTLEEALKLDLTISEAEITEFLGFSYPEYRERIRRERPDGWTIDGTVYPLKYEYRGYAKLFVPISVVRGLTSQKVPLWPGVVVQVYVTDQGYGDLYTASDKVEELAGEVEARRLENSWHTFGRTHGDYDRKVEVTYEQPFPELLAPELFDAETGARSFPAWVFYSAHSGEQARTEWYLRWYRTEDEAKKTSEAAAAKKTEADGAEYERRNLDRLTAEAQDLAREVEKLWATIDLTRSGAYGFSDEEASTSYYGSGLSRRVAQAKEMIERRQPRQALEALTALKVRIEAALAYFGQNVKLEPEATVALASSRELRERIRKAYGANVVSWEERGEVDRAFEEAESSFNRGEYLKAIEAAKKVSEKAEPILAKVEASETVRRAVADLIEREYETCPVCGGEVSRDTYHYCDWDHQGVLRLMGENDQVLRQTKVGDEVVVKLVAFYKKRRGDFEIIVTVDEAVAVGPDSRFVTEDLWASPGETQMTALFRIAQIRKILRRIEEERARENRIEIPLRLGSKPSKGGGSEAQFYCEGTFTGTVNVNKGQPVAYERRRVRFVSWTHLAYLEDDGIPQPEAGETWLCSIGFQVAFVSGTPIVTVNPLVRTDNEEAFLDELGKLME